MKRLRQAHVAMRRPFIIFVITFSFGALFTMHLYVRPSHPQPRGANVLFGGSGSTISLQPVSLQGSVSLNLALGVAGLTLTWVQ